ncbi:DUF6449 domain-containing protein [Bacillus solitudinis]|uniref:DUF6449 domain-containing protein n=1 Tax=Bacillus solitudinis TaxID=2014074 RepID=UPI000C2462AB|nr:DUF6449 domain-containing protein [Bacillus solitudinis]
MRLKTLLFNQGIFIQDIRNVGWVSLGYFLCLLFALPLQLLMAYTNDNQFYQYIPPKSLFGLSHEFQIFLTFTLPVLLAIFLFRYIQVKLSSDFTHSLPIKRGHLFNQHVIVGLLVLVIPVFMVGIVLLGLSQFMPYDELLSVQSILKWMSVTTLFNVFVFLAGVFVAMFTGMSVLQGALTYILFVFPVGVTVLFLTNLEFYLFGFAADYYLHQQIDRVIPFVRLEQLERIPLTLSEVLIYLLLSLGFYLCARLVYNRRHTETATQAIAFESLRPVFLYGTTFCTMLVGGLYFGSLQGGIGWILFGYITASLLGYFLSMMILEKSWRVFSKWKGYLIYSLVVMILGFSFQIDMFGFERKIPNSDEIEGIYFGESIYSLIELDQSIENVHYNKRDYIEQSYYYEQSESIQNIRNFHEQIIKDQLKPLSNQSNSVAVRYDLENGDQIVRKYDISPQAYDSQYREILESTEYKRNQNPVLKVEELTNLDHITINAHQSGTRVILTNQQDIEEFHHMLQADVSEQTLEEILDQRYWRSDIEYEFKDNKFLNINWKKSYSHIEEWLEEKGLLSQARETADDITYAYVMKNEENRDLYEFIHENNLELNFEQREEAIKLDDPLELEEVLKKSSGNHDGEYIIGFYYKQSSYPDFQTISLEQVPDFILKKLP